MAIFIAPVTPGGSATQVQFNDGGEFGGASTLTYDGSILTTSGRFINSYNATASSPAKVFTGTWFTGGTATTTKPQVLIEPTGTTSTAWSTAGTGFGVNAASGFAGNLLDLQLNGTSNFNVNSTGRVSFPLATAALPALYPGADTNTGMWSPAGDTLAWSTNGVERTRIDSLGRLLIGTDSTSVSASVVIQGNSASPTLNGILRLAAGTPSPADGSALGSITFHDTGHRLGYNAPAVLQAQRDGGTWTSGSSQPTRLLFQTTADGAAIPTERLRITSAGVLQVADAGNITVGTTTGTKIGTAITQKLGFYNATPVVQPAAVANATDAATVITQLNDLLAKLRTLGIIAT